MRHEVFEKYNVDGVLMAIRRHPNGYWYGRWTENGKGRWRSFGKVDPRPRYERVLVRRGSVNPTTRTVSAYETTFQQIHAFAEKMNCSILKVLLKIVGEAWQQEEEKERGA